MKAKKREQKREEAEARQAKYDKLTIAQKIKKLDKRLGASSGAKKERKRLGKLENL